MSGSLPPEESVEFASIRRRLLAGTPVTPAFAAVASQEALLHDLPVDILSDLAENPASSQSRRARPPASGRLRSAPSAVSGLEERDIFSAHQLFSRLQHLLYKRTWSLFRVSPLADFPLPQKVKDLAGSISARPGPLPGESLSQGLSRELAYHVERHLPPGGVLIRATVEVLYLRPRALLPEDFGEGIWPAEQERPQVAGVWLSVDFHIGSQTEATSVTALLLRDPAAGDFDVTPESATRAMARVSAAPMPSGAGDAGEAAAGSGAGQHPGLVVHLPLMLVHGSRPLCDLLLFSWPHGRFQAARAPVRLTPRQLRNLARLWLSWDGDGSLLRPEELDSLAPGLGDGNGSDTEEDAADAPPWSAGVASAGPDDEGTMATSAAGPGGGRRPRADTDPIPGAESDVPAAEDFQLAFTLPAGLSPDMRMFVIGFSRLTLRRVQRHLCACVAISGDT
ncbi:hypothetical protein H696_04439 [Fonticula alba]|uniref:Uncharacterized protein n=1 Tax=Fonticula alba TaxID=691883 RepID=A0A058Z424_FONAL|nr:hypothetical protein H696_04439 [Fonticula alba]KCV69019.1 hypothetical protein H696_04439 [Fonticula alba]|eukprot:XP_009496590.1 hypothetical protein H696_04439 [Fonticula alba]